MRTYFPWCALVCVAGLALGLDAHAETQASHALSTEPGTATTATAATPSQPSVPILTRQEALIQGLKQIQLSNDGVRDLVKATEKTGSITPQKFEEMVDKIVVDGGSLTKDQGEELKSLFKNELGPVKDSPVGAEFNSAAKRLLEAKQQTTTPDETKSTAKGTPETAKTQTPDGTLAGNAALQGQTLQGAVDAELGQLGQQLGAQAKAPESDIAKQLAVTQELLKGLQAEREFLAAVGGVVSRRAFSTPFARSF